jgi:hypothetical protein
VATAEQVDAAKKMPLGVTKRGSLADSSFPALSTWSSVSCVKTTATKT